ncbi:MAG: DegT/DnrJ/EryC1/StrS family aminotransferase [Synergistaceae bacterium]|nr:DegT/DnrJ/EryC1/StrS family aminotransferase [Synergistaceae bacterium]
MSGHKGRIYLSPPHMSGDETKKIEEAFATNWIAPLGPMVDAFERETAAFAGVKAALALSSGTAALHLACELLGVGGGDLVFCSTLTFAATIAPFYHKGAECAFIDSEPESWNMSHKALKRAFDDYAEIGKKPKAVIIVNLYGQSCDMDKILDICGEREVPVIEDAAESLGARYKGKQTGSFGKFSVLSYNGNKIITTSGGGMLLSDDAEAIERARFLSAQARDPAPWYQHSTLGWNYRMSNVLAGIGLGQMCHIAERVAARRGIFDRYVRELGDIEGVSFMPEPEWSESNRWLTALTINPPAKRSSDLKAPPLSVIKHLESLDIESRPVWKPMHMQPVFEGSRYYSHCVDGRSEDIAAALFRDGMCLPSGSGMTDEQQTRVIDAFKEALS